ncbi:MAG: alpha-L-fucosidase [Bacteroidota bacterium]
MNKSVCAASLVINLLALFFITPHFIFAQENTPGNNFVSLKPGSSVQEIVESAAHVVPSGRQLAWQRLETIAFVHFGLNTFYNQEWGRGNEDPGRFNPTLLNTDQWARVISESGFKMLIMTCKHHDGFCLWPSKFTTHTIASSPWMNGKGDLVKQVSESCRKYHLKFGIYLSPWDRHEPCYGNSPEYNTFFLNQLKALLSNYGTVDEVWFDGACGEGTNGKKQVYDWDSYYTLVRKLQPGAVISIMGPDVRWVGTESGYGRETEWSVVPYSSANQDSIAGNSQQAALSTGFIPPGDMEQEDLGSRNIISKASNLIWYPSEVDVSIRPGWFWHASENTRVKPPAKLLDIYFSSVGRNSTLLLNIPPDSTGLINESDINSLNSWNKARESIFMKNLAEGASIKPGNNALNITILTDKNDLTSWKPGKQALYSLEMTLESVTDFNVLLLQESISTGQRIEHFTLDAWVDSVWRPVTGGTTVGYKRLLRFPTVHSGKVRLSIDQSRLEPELSELGLYQMLPQVHVNPSSASFRESIDVVLSCDEKDVSIFYTTDGSEPGPKSSPYIHPLEFKGTTDLCCVAIRKDGTSSFPVRTSYTQGTYDIKLKNAPDEKYSGGGTLALVDGAIGTNDFADGHWIGFNGTDLDATLDLGSVRNLHEFSINFNECTKSWIFRPQQLEFLVSEDGEKFSSVYKKSLGIPEKDSEQIIRVNFDFSCKARYVKVRAINFGKLPGWHPGSGEPAWLFSDEITAR